MSQWSKKFCAYKDPKNEIEKLFKTKLIKLNKLIKKKLMSKNDNINIKWPNWLTKGNKNDVYQDNNIRVDHFYKKNGKNQVPRLFRRDYHAKWLLDNYCKRNGKHNNDVLIKKNNKIFLPPLLALFVRS
jgi:hypothetical protein